MNDAISEALQASDFLWAVACSNAAAIFVEVPINHIVTAILDCPKGARLTAKDANAVLRLCSLGAHITAQESVS